MTKRVRLASGIVATVFALSGCVAQLTRSPAFPSLTAKPAAVGLTPAVPSVVTGAGTVASPSGTLTALASLTIKGRAPKTGYARSQFGPAWSDVDHNGCDTRNDMLKRDLQGETFRAGTHNCVVLTGTLKDPYTAKTIQFAKSQASKVQIDHVVALSNSWQTGAANWTEARRLAFANDPLELLAVDGSANQSKGDGDAATWQPSNKSYRCAYVSRQVAVKAKYSLWVTRAEHDAIARVLSNCASTPTPTASPSESLPPTETPSSTPTPTISPTVVQTPAPTPSVPVTHPAGATAICNDGTYSYSLHRSGTCSHHGGVRVWL